MKRFIMVLTVLVAATGCGKKIPEPENLAAAIQSVNDLKAATTVSTVQRNDEDFQVKTFVKGNSVFVECYLKDYSFSKGNPKQLATVSVSIDDQKQDELRTAAFILKDVPNGMHKIRLEILNRSGQKTGLIKEIEVHITSSI
jgi:hypothetical protein